MRDAVRTLNPSYFALVTGTGIVSIGMHDLDVPVVSAVLLWIAAVGFVVLVLLNGWRLVAFPARARGDLADPASGFGFFTFVAGTDVLGARLALAGHHGTAPAVNAARGLVAGVSVVFWAFGTWLIPPLLAAGWWSIVFPVGMYGVATRALGNTDRLPLVGAFGRHEMWIALAAWTATALAMLRHLARTLLGTPREPD